MAGLTSADWILKKKASTLRIKAEKLLQLADTLENKADRTIRERMIAKELPDPYTITDVDFTDGINLNGQDGHSFVDYTIQDIGKKVTLKAFTSKSTVAVFIRRK